MAQEALILKEVDLREEVEKTGYSHAGTDTQRRIRKA